MCAEEGMEDWDQEKLEAAIKRKHGAEQKNNQTTIICKHFLEAVESKLYGWYATWPGVLPSCSRAQGRGLFRRLPINFQSSAYTSVVDF